MTAQIKQLFQSDSGLSQNILYKEILNLSQEVRELKRTLNAMSVDPGKKIISIPFEGSIHLILLNEIVYCKAEGSYCRLFLKDKSILLSRTLKSVQQLLPGALFIRCHQSFLINKKYVQRVSKNYFMNIKNNEQFEKIPISRSKMTLVMDWINSAYTGASF